LEFLYALPAEVEALRFVVGRDGSDRVARGREYIEPKSWGVVDRCSGAGDTVLLSITPNFDSLSFSEIGEGLGSTRPETARAAMEEDPSGDILIEGEVGSGNEFF